MVANSVYLFYQSVFYNGIHFVLNPQLQKRFCSIWNQIDGMRIILMWFI